MCKCLCCLRLSGGLRMWSVGEHGYSMFQALGLISDVAKARNMWKEEQLGISFSVSMDENLSQYHTRFFLICHLQNAHKIPTETARLTTYTDTFILYSMPNKNKQKGLAQGAKLMLKAMFRIAVWDSVWKVIICSKSAWNYTKWHIETLLSHGQWVPTMGHTDLHNS